MELKRGSIYFITFPHTFDPKYPEGKKKFVLVLQEGAYFAKYDTVEILLLTSDDAYRNNDQYVTNVEIPLGTTKLHKKSWVLCSQPYPIKKQLFEADGVWCAGSLSAEKMDEIDDALYDGLCMGLQHELSEVQEDEIEEAVV